MQELTLLHTKLDKLLKKYTALQAENDKLLGTIREQNDKLEVLNGNIKDLEDKLATAGTADIMSDNDGKSAVKKQLNSLIKDIDKLLASLND